MTERVCPTCGGTFTPTVASQRFCPPTKEDRLRVAGQPRSRCARRYQNAQHRHGRAISTTELELPAPFDCENCGTRCIPGENVAPHATKFCGAGCKSRAHKPSSIELTVQRAESAPRTSVAEFRRVLRRDPCAYCGSTDSRRTVDHIQPRCIGGGDEPENLTAACQSCNSSKQRSPLLLFLGWKRARDEFAPWSAAVTEIHRAAA
jgi:hypothetical protein